MWRGQRERDREIDNAGKRSNPGHGATTNEKKAKSQAVQLSPAGITSTSVRGIKHGDTATDR